MTVHSLLSLIKTRNILATVALVATLGAGISAEAVTNVTIISDIEDRGVGLYTNGVLGFTWINEPTISVGDDNHLYNQSNTCTILVFELPSLQSLSISNANLAVDVLKDYIGGLDPYPKGVDLYGVRYDASPTVVLGDYGHGGSGSGTLLQTDMIVATNHASTGYSIESTDALGGGQLALWLTAQYDAGAVPGDYAFLRLENDEITGNPFKIASADTTLQTPPELTVVLGPDGYVAPPPPPAPTGFTIPATLLDQQVRGDGTVGISLNWSGQQNDQISGAQSGEIVVQFALPDLEGGTISSANLLAAMNAPTWQAWGNVDVYGVRYAASAAVTTNDYAPFSDAAGNGTKIMDNFYVSGTGTAAYQDLETDATGDTALAAWLIAQYDAGAVAGDYVFFRFQPDHMDAINGHAIEFATADTVLETTPVLTIELDVPVVAAEFVSVEPVSAGVLKLVFSASEPLASRKLVGRPDLTDGSWIYVPHSDNSSGPFTGSDLSTSTPEGGNYAIYVETTGSTEAFYGIE